MSQKIQPPSETSIRSSFSEFLAEKPVQEPKAPVKAGMTFENPNVCHYCNKPMERTRIEDEDVLVCWDDRNVTPVFTG